MHSDRHRYLGHATVDLATEIPPTVLGVWFGNSITKISRTDHIDIKANMVEETRGKPDGGYMITSMSS